jgi:hypothetical protein
MTAVSAQGLYQEAVRQKGVLITNSLFKLTRDNKDAEIRAHKRGYHATVKLLGDPPHHLGDIYCQEPSGQMARSCN